MIIHLGLTFYSACLAVAQERRDNMTTHTLVNGEVSFMDTNVADVVRETSAVDV
jgi:hypothetical protein